MGRWGGFQMILEMRSMISRFKVAVGEEKAYGLMLTLGLSGVFLIGLARALFPRVRKLRDGKVTNFHKRYLYSAIESMNYGNG